MTEEQIERKRRYSTSWLPTILTTRASSSSHHSYLLSSNTYRTLMPLPAIAYLSLSSFFIPSIISSSSSSSSVLSPGSSHHPSEAKLS
jgi:hypothetical protein